MTLGEALRATLAVARVLDQLGVPYLVGGSLASSFHGIPRSTQDADLVADLRPEHVAPLVAVLSATFYVDEERTRQAVEGGGSFNVIQLATMFKVDVFVVGDDPPSRSEMERREKHPVGPAGEELYLASAEDTILHKLRWYEMGNRVSERQWNDLLGVLKVRRGALDREYLRENAERMGTEGLLEEALAELERSSNE